MSSNARLILQPEVIAETIKSRKTLKVIGDHTQPARFDPNSAERNDGLVKEALAVAGYAPFHFNRGVDDIAEPWRAHVLTHVQCQALAAALPNWFERTTPESKIVQMLYASGALVLVTWLPEQVDADARLPRHDHLDSEHLAATAAMTQNLLLMLTAQGMGTYWSSGGILSTRPCLDQLGISSGERLLAAVFIEYPETLKDERERKPGANRERRCTDWIQTLTVTE
ncbi:MAG: nitroreductase family protein [Pseudomonadota bacterium]